MSEKQVSSHFLSGLMETSLCIQAYWISETFFSEGIYSVLKKLSKGCKKNKIFTEVYINSFKIDHFVTERRNVSFFKKKHFIINISILSECSIGITSRIITLQISFTYMFFFYKKCNSWKF